MRTERVQAFSDGIFAILITILVLEFKVPSYVEGRLFSAIVHYWPVLFAYILTYFYIGILWLFHHDVFQILIKTTVKLNVLNLILIFFITLLSFSMSLLGESMRTLNTNDLQVSCYIYTFLALMISLIFLLIYNYIFKNPELIEQKISLEHLKKKQKYPILSIFIYCLAFVFTYFNVFLGLLFLVLGIINHGIAYARISSLTKNHS
ncbi:TMEM175 family protein (plasmid) [Enterococcus sp. 22-H-5-01]|uniref:TMEM175 family protein n=1 Tax=Enterococcus sp. 22-H-5-01 TaxID=3418555 RepID=UPI003D08E97F